MGGANRYAAKFATKDDRSMETSNIYGRPDSLSPMTTAGREAQFQLQE